MYCLKPYFDSQQDVQPASIIYTLPSYHDRSAVAPQMCQTLGPYWRGEKSGKKRAEEIENPIASMRKCKIESYLYSVALITSSLRPSTVSPFGAPSKTLGSIKSR
ncbi:hypothetical protein Tcan_02575 [Toxocara canis]|uniref:Uncharacterized protein n=1 Tax=Toxocara canis TaxID=6265 RepID=A0A0B2UPH2_TOXCA|nr:hypothetical protein Tcan_02575 [Toxocara canis]